MSNTETLTLTPKEAADELRMSRMSIHRFVSSGELESYKIGRARRIPRSALEQFLEAHKGQSVTT